MPLEDARKPYDEPIDLPLQRHNPTRQIRLQWMPHGQMSCTPDLLQQRAQWAPRIAIKYLLHVNTCHSALLKIWIPPLRVKKLINGHGNVEGVLLVRANTGEE